MAARRYSRFDCNYSCDLIKAKNTCICGRRDYTYILWEVLQEWSLNAGNFVLFSTTYPGRWSRFTGGRSSKVKMYYWTSVPENVVLEKRWSLMTVVSQNRYHCIYFRKFCSSTAPRHLNYAQNGNFAPAATQNSWFCVKLRIFPNSIHKILNTRVGYKFGSKYTCYAAIWLDKASKYGKQKELRFCFIVYMTFFIYSLACTGL